VNNEFEVFTRDESNLRNHHFDAIYDLVTAFDANFACSSVLRRIADMSGSTSSFISVVLPEGLASEENIFSSASCGPFFPVVKSSQKAAEVLTGFGWINLHEPFSRTLQSAGSFPNQTFIGYPLFDQLGQLTASFAVIISSPTSQEIIEEHCSRILALLIHRVQEFHFLQTIITQKSENEVFQLSKRGLIFPSLSDMYSQSAHSINGQLAVASLQSQILTNPDITNNTLSQGLIRVSKAVAQTGLLLHRQENAFSLLVDQGRTSQLSTSIEMAKESFDLVMTRKIPSVLHMNVSSEMMIEVPGNVAFWVFHNVLRMVASIYQWVPGPEKPIQIYATTITQSTSTQTHTEFRVHIPFDSFILELSKELFSDSPAYLSSESLPNVGAILFGIMSMLNFTWSLESTDEEIIIMALISDSRFQ